MTKRYLSLLLAAFLMLPQFCFAQDLKVMSFNVRMSSANDGTNSWALRYPAVGDMFKDQKPDIMGVQEALYEQIYFFDNNFKDYKYVGVGREDGKKEGEFMAIFWNKKTVSLLDWGTYWLSETPDKPSMGWDAACFRTATWALMKDKKTGKKFYFVNTHLDHVGKEARRNGLKLVMDKIAAMNKDGLPLVLTGDFNVTPDDPALVDVDANMKSARKVAEKTDNTGTFNNWGKASSVIDYIYFTGFSSCPEYHTVTEKYAERKFVSDHYPITAELNF
ncbi:MAG: endonuclease/exonuclease/phosphatase family protein [Bacteroidales bacterium]|nr:endonuclease/exonuclease/phosphatase family protein [Bacteroidales bacterium]